MSLNDVKNPVKIFNQKKRTPIIYGVYDNRDQPFWVRLNDFLVDHSQVSVMEKMHFFQLMSTMVGAGLPIVKALKILAARTKHKRFQRVLDTVASEVDKGLGLSVAISKFPAVFDEAEVGMISSGEATGNLNQILLRLADQLEKVLNLNMKVKGALFYPLAVLVALFIAGFIIMVVVIPRIVVVFNQLEGEIPTSTKILIGLSSFFVNFWPIIIIGVIGIIFGIRYFISTEKGRILWDYHKLKIPVFGELWKKIAISKFVRTLSNLISSGIPVGQALTLTGQAIGNVAYQKKTEEIRARVEEGEKISANLGGDDNLFPETVIHIIEIGENSATLEKTSEKIAAQYDREVEYVLKNLTSFIEPAVIGIMGLLIGFLAIAVMSPIFKLSELI